MFISFQMDFITFPIFRVTSRDWALCRKIEMEERPIEVFCILGADKKEPGAFNFPLWKMFVDARSNSGLMINEKLASGVTFRILDVIGGKVILVANLISLKTFPLSLLCITKHK